MAKAAVVRKEPEADDMAESCENTVRMTETQIPDGPFRIN